MQVKPPELIPMVKINHDHKNDDEEMKEEEKDLDPYVKNRPQPR
jgi:hypothetical protein